MKKSHHYAMIADYMVAVEQGRIEPQENRKATFFVFASCNDPRHVNEQGMPTPWHIKSPPVSFGPLVIGSPRERGETRPLNTEGDDIETVQSVLTRIVLHMHHEDCPGCDKTPVISSLIG